MSDLIRRKNIKNLLCDLHVDNISINDKNILEFIDELPTVEAIPVVNGEWIFKCEGSYNRRRAYCSVCGKRSGIGGIKENQMKPYCPNCGAKMKVGGVNER